MVCGKVFFYGTIFANTDNLLSFMENVSGLRASLQD